MLRSRPRGRGCAPRGCTRRALPPVLRPLHRRRLGGLPRRGPVLEPLRQGRGPRARGSPSCSRAATVVHVGRARPARGRRAGPRSDSSSGREGTLGVITEATLVARRAPAAEARRAYSFDAFADGLDACRAVAAARRDPGGAAPLRRGRVARGHFEVERVRARSSSTRATPRWSPPRCASLDEECARARARSTTRSSRRWLERRNDVGGAGAAVGGAASSSTRSRWPRAWCGARRGAPRRRPRRSARCPRPSSRRCTSRHAYLDGACLYFTFAGRPEADPDRLLPRAPGTRRPTRRSRPARRSATTTASAATARASWRARWATPTPVLVSAQGRARPRRRAQPRGPRARGRAVVRRARDRRRHDARCARRSSTRRRRSRATHQPAPARRRPAPGDVELDAGEIADAVLELARRSARRRRRRRRRRHHQPARDDHRVRRGDRRAGRAGARLAGPAHGASTASILQGEGLRLAPNQSATKLRWLVARARGAPVARPRASPPSRPGSRGASPSGALHVTDHSNAAVTGLVDPATRELGPSTCSSALGLDAPRCMPRDRRHDRGRARRASALPGRPADRRARRRPAGVALRPVAASRAGPSSPSAPAPCSTWCVGPGPAAGCTRLARRVLPDRRVARAPARSPGGSRRSCSRPGACVEWLRDGLGLIGDAGEADALAQSVGRRRRRRLRAGPGRARHPVVGLRRARGVLRAHPGRDPRPPGARGARGRRPARRRPRRGRARRRPATRPRRAARRRGDDREPVVPPGAGRRDRRARRRLERASRPRPAAPGSWPWSARARIEPSRRRGALGARPRPTRPRVDDDERAAQRARWAEAVGRVARTIPELSAVEF